MYRLFAIDSSGRLYQFGSGGWSRTVGTSFMSIDFVRDFLYTHVMPDIPNRIDSFIAQVDSSGMILSTYPVLEECND